MNDTNPIDHFIVALLFLFEGIAWLINELAGHHDLLDTTIDVPSHSLTEFQQDWFAYVHNMTVKQLQQYVGTKNSRYRKHQLIALALS